MTLATLEADGVEPSRQDRFALCKLIIRTRLERANWRDVRVALLVGAGALAVLAGIGLAVAPKPTAPPRVQAGQIPNLITPEALTGPKPGIADTVDSKHLLQDLLTKAGLRPNFDPHRLSWDQARRINALLPDAHAPLQTAQPFSISLTTKNGKEALHCLTQAAYYEAGANGPEAEAAVVQVVLNRVHHPDFPKTVCGVVYQGADRDSGCQFTFTCDGALARPVDKAAWDAASKVAARALSGYVVKAVGASTYYHANYVFPVWAPTLDKITTVGPHIFYSLNGAEGPLLTGHYSGGELKLANTMLKAVDRFTVKPKAAVQTLLASTTQAKADQAPAAAPAGLKLQADRLQRVHEAFAAQTVDRPKVETASALPTGPAPDEPTAAAGAPAA